MLFHAHSLKSLSRGWLIRLWLFFVLLSGLTAGCSTAPIQNGTPVLRTASFTFPSLASILPALIEAENLDTAYGFELRVVPYGTVSAYYAGLVSGEVDTLPGGPLVLQRMRNQGVPIVITNTYATLASLVVISRHPAHRTLDDLHGMRLAADMGSSEYQILRLIARHRGLTLGSDIEVIQAVPSVSRAHLLTGEADAILTFEPVATMVLSENPDYQVVFKGEESWSEVSRLRGWLLVSLMREEFAGKNPELLSKWEMALRDAARMVHEEPEKADQIVSRRLAMPAGLLARAVREQRIRFEIDPASDQKAELIQMFHAAVELGFVDRVPDAQTIYQPSSASKTN